MTALAPVNKYLNNHYEGMHPEQLILMLYKGALVRIQLTREGIQENNRQKRGENLSKLIAIISELNASIDPEINDESTQFLRGLYRAILNELPKISLNNCIVTLDRTETYIKKLKNIWENDVMGNTEKKAPTPVINSVKRNIQPASAHGYGDPGTVKRFSTISV